MPHLLLLEDDADIRLVLERMLRAAGYCVSSAEDGEAGWSALAADSYDLLITDHDVPKLLGLDLLRRLTFHRGIEHAFDQGEEVGKIVRVGDEIVGITVQHL